MRGIILIMLTGASTCLRAQETSFEKTVAPFLARNCLVCHSSKLRSGGLDLEQFHSAGDVLAHRDIWRLVARKLTTGEMPPPAMPRPQASELRTVTQWIGGELARSGNAPADPGRVTARRLNRYEYNCTVRDLLAVDFHPADDFPADDFGYGFDNIGDVLSLSPVLMEKYLAAAERIAKAAIAIDPLPQPTLVRHGRREDLGEIKNGGLSVKLPFALEADYDFTLGVGGRVDPLNLTVFLDGKTIQTTELTNDKDIPRVADVRVHVLRGQHVLGAELIPTGPPLADDRKPDNNGKVPPPKPNPNVGYIDVRGPFNPVPPPPPESHKLIFACGHEIGHHNSTCARIDLAQLARRAYRRPVTDAEIDGLVRFVNMAQAQGDSFEQGMRIAIEAMLVSPHFLFRVERDSDPANAGPHNIGDYELAARLSYFLWSSLPDDELFRAAGEHGLRRPETLEAQVRRMLADPKSKALVENFAGQWLELRNLDSIKPDPGRFPMFDAELRQSMQRETQLFFQSIVHEDRGILDFLDANYTFLNERLARFYGIEGVQGKEFRKVDLTGNPERGGVITQASVLTVSSYPTRTSPVIRGKWLLENILNAPPPPPPPDVPNLDEAAIGATMSLREQLEKHRANAVCASCHSRMDPLGFGLENYDAIGRWRTHDGKFAIDASGTLPDGKSFSGPAELKNILLARKDAFVECLTRKLLTYALGRGLESYDDSAVQLIIGQTQAGEYRFSRLIMAIVESPPFEMRRGSDTEASKSKMKVASR